MKKTLILATLLTLACSLAAQAGSAFSLGVEARGWKPDQLEKLTDNDTLLGGAVRMLIGLGPYLALDVSGGIVAAREEVTIDYGHGYREKYDVDVDAIPVQAGLLARIPICSSLDLVAGGGAGYYWIQGEVSDHYDRHRSRRHYEDCDIGKDMGFYALAGLDWAPARCVSLYAEVRYDWLTFDFDDEFKEYAEETGMGKELSFDGIGAAVGLRFNF